jgi:flagellar biosynthesis/type III secretory pathway chaperone
MQYPQCLEPETIRLREKTSIHLQSEIAELTGQKKRLQKRVESVDHARIEIEHTVHAAVRYCHEDFVQKLVPGICPGDVRISSHCIRNIII